MGEKLKKVATLVGVAALVVTGVGVYVAGIGLAAGLGTTIGIGGLTLGTVAAIGIASLSIGSMPSRPSQEQTGAATRGQAYADPSSLGAYVFGRSVVPLEVLNL